MSYTITEEHKQAIINDIQVVQGAIRDVSDRFPSSHVAKLSKAFNNLAFCVLQSVGVNKFIWEHRPNREPRLKHFSSPEKKEKSWNQLSYEELIYDSQERARINQIMARGASAQLSGIADSIRKAQINNSELSKPEAFLDPATNRFVRPFVTCNVTGHKIPNGPEYDGWNDPEHKEFHSAHSSREIRKNYGPHMSDPFCEAHHALAFLRYMNERSK